MSKPLISPSILQGIPDLDNNVLYEDHLGVAFLKNSASMRDISISTIHQHMLRTSWVWSSLTSNTS